MTQIKLKCLQCPEHESFFPVPLLFGGVKAIRLEKLTQKFVMERNAKFGVEFCFLVLMMWPSVYTIETFKNCSGLALPKVHINVNN